MDISSILTSKGQVTIPKQVREALSIKSGDSLFFRVEENGATIAKTPDFLSLAGSVEVPASKRGTAWSKIVKDTHSQRATKRH